jgi:phage gp45-like
VRHALQRTWNRVRHALAFGQIISVDDTGPVQMAQVAIGGLEVHDRMPVVTFWGFASNPPSLTNAVLQFVAGARSNKVCVGTTSPTGRMKNLLSGETALYDFFGKSVYLTENNGVVVQANGQPVSVLNSNTVTIVASTEVICNTPIFKCTGDVLDHCNTQSNTMALMRSIYDGHNHNILNVQAGTSTKVTEVPNQLE